MTAPPVSPPDTPLNLVAAPGDGQASLAWDMPLTNLPTGYTALVTATGTVPGWSEVFGTLQVVTCAAPATSLVVPGLVDGATFTITLSATNDLGDSAQSAPVTVTPQLGLVNPPLPAVVPPPYLVQDAYPPVPATAAPYPIPVAQQDLRALLARIAAGVTPGFVAGQVQMAALVDTVTGEVLVITPNTGGGIWLNDLDLGFPEVRTVSTSWPNRSGSIDETSLFGSRAITMSLTCVDAPDASGIVRSATAWAGAVRSWATLGRKVKLVYQLLDQRVRQCPLRVSTLGAPIIGSGTDRVAQKVTLGWVNPSPFLYTVPLSDEQFDPDRPDWFRVSVGSPSTSTIPTGPGLSMNGVTGLNLGGAVGVNFGGGQAAGGNSTVVVPQSLVGSVATSPVISVRGGVTSPKFSMIGAKGVRGALEFGANVGGNLVVAASDLLVVDVLNRTALIFPGGDTTQPGISKYKYLSVPSNWQGLTVVPQDKNQFNFYPVSTNPGTTAYLSWRSAHI